ncbi:MAG: hypothetical protein ACREM2_08980 [Vulcanimicrobiaceae bacterium]
MCRSSLATKRLPLGTVALGCALLVACDASSPATPACGAPRGQVSVAYPAPNSQNIPDDFSGVIFASTNGLANSYQAIIVANGTADVTELNTVVAAAPPFPTPFATPPFPGPVYQVSTYPNAQPLLGFTPYYVYLNDTNSNCAPTLLSHFTSH